MSAPLTIGYGNIGHPDHPSGGVDTQALEALFDAMPDRRWAVLLCEINEGDNNDELALAKRLAPPGSRFYCQRSREPMILSPDFPRARSRVVWVPDTGVKRWSPQRSVNLVHVPGENLTLIGSHPAAGAYHGDRPAAARKALIKSWDKTFATHRLIEEALHARGRNVAWAIDYNRVNLPDVVAGEREVFSDVTDHGRVLPAPGWTAITKYVRRVPFRVDSHDGHVFRVQFRERT